MIKKIGKYIFGLLALGFLSIGGGQVAHAQTTPSATLGIDCAGDKLVNGQCKFNFNAMIGKKAEAGDSLSDPVTFLQDIFLTATMFISVLCSIGLIYSGYLYIIGGYDAKKIDQAKKGFSYSLIGLLITIFSVVIVRLAQYFATGNFGL